jgi:hypothetical protein
MPTVLGLLGEADGLNGKVVDGVDLSAQLRRP